MEIGLHVANFTWPGGPGAIAEQLTRVVTTAEDVGMSRVSVMDHVWQIGPLGPPEEPMLEAYTTLGYLAARTSRVELLAWVTAVSYRDPGLLAKIISTLDVLSNGRAWLGIGAAWNGEESEGLGLFFPPTAERFERLEETLRICLQMWSDDDGPFEGAHYRLGRTLNSPQPIRRPHPPILIGGGGEKKTLRLVAQYAQACNLFAFDDVERKLDVLRGHCADVGRDYDEIEKTVMVGLDPGADGEKVDELLANLQRLAGLGFTEAHGWVPGVRGDHPAGGPRRAGDPGGGEVLSAAASVHTDPLVHRLRGVHGAAVCTSGRGPRTPRPANFAPARPRTPVPGTRRAGAQPIVFWPSIVSRMMSACPECWAVSATMCRNTRRAERVAPGANHGAGGSGCARSRSGSDSTSASVRAATCS